MELVDTIAYDRGTLIKDDVLSMLDLLISRVVHDIDTLRGGESK